MKLEQFIASKVHGYRDFNIKFNSKVTYLTGINGSGKTTVLNCIIALITPSLSTLFDISFTSLKLDLLHNDESSFVEAKKSGDLLVLHSTSAREPLQLKAFARSDTSTERELDYEQEYYRELAASQSDHPVMKFIAALPTPMFLPLDRRSRTSGSFTNQRVFLGSSRRAPGRNVFNSTLARSVTDAIRLVETRFRDSLIREGRLGEEFRKNMLLDLMKVEPAKGTSGFALSLPTKSDLQDISAMRKKIGSLTKTLRLPPEEIEQRIVPLLDLLDQTARTISPDRSIEQILKSWGKESSTEVDALFTWSVNSVHLKRIRSISELYSQFEAQDKKLNEPKDHYLALLNQFLKDARKTVEVDQDGYISYSIKGVDGKQPITSLSSGEAQVFVILTQLSFNRLASQANVFIVDEPELSLHVNWQEMLVESMCKANPNIQYVMATHSPSIILEQTGLCVDLSEDQATSRSNVDDAEPNSLVAAKRTRTRKAAVT